MEAKGREGRKLLREVKEAGGGILEKAAARALLALTDLLFRWKKEKYRRALPFGDLLVDREEKAKFLGFGEGTTVYDNVVVLGNVSVGRNTWIGPNVVLDGSGGLAIGSNCSISAGVHIYTHDTVRWAVSGGKAPYEYGTTTIDDDCYIGPNAIIQKGVRIGRGSIVGACSFVNRDVQRNTKVAGIPARILGPVAEGVSPDPVEDLP